MSLSTALAIMFYHEPLPFTCAVELLKRSSLRGAAAQSVADAVMLKLSQFKGDNNGI